MLEEFAPALLVLKIEISRVEIVHTFYIELINE